MGIDESPVTDPRSTGLTLIDPVPYDRIPELLSSCKAGVIGYTGSAAAESLGNRTFEYLAAALPVLAPVESPLIAEFVQRHSYGIIYSNKDPATLADAILRIVDTLTRQGS